MNSPHSHLPVLLSQVVGFVRPVDPSGTIVDATIGLGGHAEALLERYQNIQLIGIDRDRRALAAAAKRLERFGSRVQLEEGRHEMIAEILDRRGVAQAGAILADLGVSSMQLDDPARGFSFRSEGPLDMRMSAEGRTAADIINESDERELVRILRDYGEEPMARRIVRAIVQRRAEEPFETTAQLAEVVRGVKPPRRRDEIDPATLTFQALRIATNEELTHLESFLIDSVRRLETGGRLAVISFHSLEDRIVKQTFRMLETDCICPPRMPVCNCDKEQEIEILTKRPVVADDEEVATNPRARSAKLRVAERIAVTA